MGFDPQWTRYVGGQLKSGLGRRRFECFDDLK